MTMPAPTIFAEMDRAKEVFAVEVRQRLQPLFRPGDDLNLEIVVRSGRLRVKVEAVSKDPVMEGHDRMRRQTG